MFRVTGLKILGRAGIHIFFFNHFLSGKNIILCILKSIWPFKMHKLKEKIIWPKEACLKAFWIIWETGLWVYIFLEYRIFGNLIKGYGLFIIWNNIWNIKSFEWMLEQLIFGYGRQFILVLVYGILPAP